MERQTCSALARTISKQGYRILNLCAVSLMLLAIIDLNGRYKSIDDSYKWLAEQRQILDGIKPERLPYRHKRDVSDPGSEAFANIQAKLDRFELRLNRSKVFKALLNSPFAVWLPYLKGPAGSTGTPGKKGEKGESGDIGPTGKKGPRGIKGKDYKHYLQNTGTSSYVRWGRSDCPNINGTKMVYTGYTGGQYYDHTGGMSNTVCLHSKPNFEKYSDSIDTAQYIYGLEYEVSMFSPFKTAGLHNKDAPCSVCEVETRGTQIMIPGRNVCPTGWTLEYKGYLMSAHYGHKGRSTAVCVDNDAEGFPRSEKDQNGNLWYTIQASCGSLPCGPYIQGRELTCAVCTI